MTPSERAEQRRRSARAGRLARQRMDTERIRSRLTPEQLERRRLRRRDIGQAPGLAGGWIQLDGPDSVDRWVADERPRCPRCGNPARWSTVVNAWCHDELHPDHDATLPADHNVGQPEWVPIEYAGEVEQP